MSLVSRVIPIPIPCFDNDREEYGFIAATSNPRKNEEASPNEIRQSIDQAMGFTLLEEMIKASTNVDLVAMTLYIVSKTEKMEKAFILDVLLDKVIHKRDTNTIIKLLEYGANPNRKFTRNTSKGDSLNTAFWMYIDSAQKSPDVSVVKLFLEKGATEIEGRSFSQYFQHYVCNKLYDIADVFIQTIPCSLRKSAFEEGVTMCVHMKEQFRITDPEEGKRFDAIVFAFNKMMEQE